MLTAEIKNPVKEAAVIDGFTRFSYLLQSLGLVVNGLVSFYFRVIFRNIFKKTVAVVAGFCAILTNKPYFLLCYLKDEFIYKGRDYGKKHKKHLQEILGFQVIHFVSYFFKQLNILSLLFNSVSELPAAKRHFN